jgi:hypothetical protein
LYKARRARSRSWRLVLRPGAVFLPRRSGTRRSALVYGAASLFQTGCLVFRRCVLYMPARCCSCCCSLFYALASLFFSRTVRTGQRALVCGTASLFQTGRLVLRRLAVCEPPGPRSCQGVLSYDKTLSFFPRRRRTRRGAPVQARAPQVLQGGSARNAADRGDDRLGWQTQLGLDLLALQACQTAGFDSQAFLPHR